MMLLSARTSHLKHLSWQVVLSCYLMLCFSSFCYAQPIKLDLYTDEFPPLQVEVNDEAKGYVIEFIQALVNDASQALPMSINEVHFVPWKRAMNITETTENALLFSILRTPSREEKYQWIGEVSPYETTLYRHVDGPDLIPTKLDDLIDFRFGAQSGGAFADLLREKGVTDIMTVTYGRRAIKLLSAHRVDYAPLVASSFYYRMEQYGYNPDEFLPVLKIDELSKELWLVTGTKTSEEVVSALKSSYLRLKESGKLNQLIKQYTPDCKVMKAYRKQKALTNKTH